MAVVSPEPSAVQTVSADDDSMDFDRREPPVVIDPTASDVEERANVLHVHGTDNMSTDQVFQYLRDYGPSHIEWINDSSCMSPSPSP